jgi:hypothetical protein
MTACSSPTQLVLVLLTLCIPWRRHQVENESVNNINEKCSMHTLQLLVLPRTSTFDQVT